MIKKGDWYRCIISKSHCFTDGKHYIVINGIICTDQGDYKVLNGMDSIFQKLYTIQDLKDGKVAVVNDGTLGDLREVLAYAFEEDDFMGSGSYKYYFKDAHCVGFWDGGDKTDLPTQSVKDFLVQLPKEVIIEDHDTLNTRREKLGYKPVVNTSINPKHYSFNIKGTPCDLFDIGNAMDLNKEQFTALRYFRKKENQIEDTKKAIKCLERLVERLESEQND